MKPILLRALALALILTLCAMPLAAAQQAHQFTLSGLTLTMDGQDPLDVGLKARLRYGRAKPGEEFLAVALEGAGDIFKMLMAQAGVKLRLTMGRLTDTYEFDYHELQKEVGDPELEGEIDALMKVLGQFSQRTALTVSDMLAYYEDKEGSQKAVQEMLDELVAAGIYRSGQQETAKINGQTVPATRYDFAMSATQRDRSLRIGARYSKEIERIVQLDCELYNIMDRAQYRPESLYAQRYKGKHYECQGSVWRTQDGSAIRNEVVQRTTTPQGAVDQMVEQFNRSEVTYDDKGVTYFSAVDEVGGGLKVHLEYTVTADWPLDASALRVNCQMQVEPEQRDESSAPAAQGAFDLDVKQGAVDLDAQITLRDGDVWSDELTVGFVGDYSPDALRGRATLAAHSTARGEAGPGNEIAFDIDYGAADWPVDELDGLWAAEGVDMLNMTGAQQEKFDREMLAMSIYTMGALVNTPGMARLISTINMAARKEFSRIMDQYMESQDWDQKLDA